MKKPGIVAAAALLAAGCTPMEVVGTVGAVVFAPITATIMAVEARRNDRGSEVERARKNDEPPPAIDSNSTEQARATLELALEQALDEGVVGQDFYWENPDDAEVGPVSGLVMIVPVEQEDAAGRCREALIGTFLERHTDLRVRTYCRDGDAWRDGPPTGDA